MVDSYTLRARTSPAVLVAVPPLCLAGFGVATATSGGRLAAAVSAALVIAPHLARDAGRRVEGRLWRSWDGPPTTRLLRHRDQRSAQRSERARARVEAATGLELPSAQEERRDPAAADDRYEQAVSVLRGRTRDRDRFHLSFKRTSTTASVGTATDSGPGALRSQRLPQSLA
jgi:hypothetical protein